MYEGIRTKGEKNLEDNSIVWKEYVKKTGSMANFGINEMKKYCNAPDCVQERCRLFFCKIGRFFGINKSKINPLKSPPE